jgi:hypothetical protein
VIFIIKAKTMDKFNLQGYLKNNQLLNENIGGYVDMKPVKEEIGTAMGEYDEKDSMIFGKDWEYEDNDELGPSIEGLISQKYLAVFVEAVETMIDDLEGMGFEEQDVKNYLINKMSDI